MAKKNKRRGVLGLSAGGERTINGKTRSEDPEAWKSADEQLAAFMDAQRKSPAFKLAQQAPSLKTIQLLCRAKGIPLDDLSVGETAILGIMLNGSTEAKSLADAVAVAARPDDRRPGYLDIVLDVGRRTITRVGSDIPPIPLSDLQCELCKVFVAAEFRGVTNEQLSRLPIDTIAPRMAISGLRQKVLKALGLSITDGCGGKPRILVDATT